MYLFICLLMAFMWYLTKKIYICKILYLKDMNVWLQGLTILVLKILQLWLLNFCVGPWKRLSSASVCVFVSHKSCPRSYLVHAISHVSSFKSCGSLPQLSNELAQKHCWNGKKQRKRILYLTSSGAKFPAKAKRKWQCDCECYSKYGFWGQLNAFVVGCDESASGKCCKLLQATAMAKT